MMTASVDLERIEPWIRIGSYIQAYRALLTGLEASPGDAGLFAAPSRLAAVLRSRGWDLGSKARVRNATHGEAVIWPEWLRTRE